ncbi:MAG: protein kinase [Bacteroidota bacterium]
MANSTFKSQISEGNSLPAIKEFYNFLEDFYQKYKNEATLLSSRQEINEQAKRDQTISFEEYNMHNNRITLSFLELLADSRSNFQKYFGLAQFSTGNKEETNTLHNYVYSRSRGRYKINIKKPNNGLIKNGANWITYYASDEILKREVVIKIQKVNSFNLDEVSMDKPGFQSEVDRVKPLKHRNIIKLLDVYYDEAPYFIITEYVWGVSVNELLASIKSIPFSLTLEVLIELCQVLEYLRYRKIYHTGLRPSDILLDEENKPMLSPFEVIKANSAKRKFDKFMQDCQYLAPEILNLGANPEVEPDTLAEAETCDQFSIGLTAFEMLTGEPLFTGKNIPDIIKNRENFFKSATERNLKWAKLRKIGCSPEFINLIKKLLQEKPSDRYQSVSSLGDDLARFKPKLDKTQRSLLRSYNRCLAARPDFTAAFYEALFSKMPPGVRDQFTNLERQQKMLQLSQRAFLESGADSDFIRHLPNIEKHKGVTFDQYKIFIETLIETAKESDPDWNLPEVSEAWIKTSEQSLQQLKELLEGAKK